ncbi:MAG: NUDIX hydrolase [Bacteroidota bacterium]|nr:NUDIX hydrolase [Bacteroidota bacterium]
MMRDLTWKKLSSSYVFNDRWFKARADSCQFPDGRIIEPYYIVEVPDWCNTVVITEDEKMILVRQYRYPVNQTTLELPGGIMEKGETPLSAAKREMEEETGYTSQDIQFLMKLAPNPALHDNTAYFFLARNAVPTVSKNLDPYEDLDILFFTKQEVLALLKENKIQHGVQVGPLYQALFQLGWLCDAI